MGSAGRSRKTGTKSRKTKLHKLAVKAKFNARHIDQVVASWWQQTQESLQGCHHAAWRLRSEVPPAPAGLGGRAEGGRRGARRQSGAAGHHGQVRWWPASGGVGGGSVGPELTSQAAASPPGAHMQCKTCLPPLTACRAELDEDLPANGAHFCTACSRYFASPRALLDHEKTKPHRRWVWGGCGCRRVGGLRAPCCAAVGRVVD